MSFSSCMFDEYPNLSPNIGGAEITLPGCKTMYRYGVAIPSTLLAQQSKVKINVTTQKRDQIILVTMS